MNVKDKRPLFYDFDVFRLDVENEQLLRRGSPITLTQKSFEVLQFLVQNRGRLLRKQELLSELWSDTHVVETTLTQHIYMLRKALSPNGESGFPIETIPKNGYRFNGEVEEIFGVESEEFQTASIEFVPKNVFEEKVASFYKQEECVATNLRNQKINRRWALFLPILFVLVLGTYIFVLSGSASYENVASTAPKSIAVLPFRQIDSQNEKLGLGIADSLISRISKLENVRVLPTTSVIRYEDANAFNLFEVGRELDVDTVLVGTVQHDKDHLRVTYQLYDLKTELPVFSEIIDGDYSNLFAFQDEISNRVVQQISNRQQLAVKGYYTTSPDALNHYSRGLSLWNKRTKSSRDLAAAEFKKAIEIDPEFDLPYAFLADTYAIGLSYGETLDNLSGNELLSSAKSYAEKALRLNQGCAEAYIALSLVSSSEAKTVEAFDFLQKALALAPNSATAHQRKAWLYAIDGELEKAISETKLALSFDSQAQAPNLAMASYLNFARQPEESIIYSDKALKIDPESKHARILKAQSYEQLGILNEALALYIELKDESDGKNDDLFYNIAVTRIREKLGIKNDGISVFAKKSSNDSDVLYQIALGQLTLGNKDEALAIIERIVDIEGKRSYPQLKFSFELDELRSNPKFEKLLERLKTKSS